MSTFANRSNHSAVMSESDHDDELEQNESVMHKVKDVVSKIFHPSFLFSASADSSRSKRKRTTSIENQGGGGEEKPAETASSNGHGTTSKSILQRRVVNEDEGQLTDDEDSSALGNVLPTEEDRPDAEQLKKRRRTGNYQNVLPSNTNGNRSDEKHSPLNNSTNNVGTFSSRRILDYATNHSTSLLPPPSTDSDSIAEGNPSASSTVKTRFNIPSLNRGLNSSYDPSQSPLFSVTSRKPAETATTPARTTTNLKSTTNEFSANYLLASGLVQRSASTSSSVSASTLTNPNSTHTQRLLSTERQMLGVNYASINSRRLPYIERLRRRTLQDCIRLNRTLDSEPLSISTIEEHTSAAASPIRKPTRTLEKDCGIQCNISNNDSLVEPSRKVQRTFPPPDIRNEALSVPNYDKGQSATTSQSESSIQTNSSISFEPIRPVQIDITKPKVLGNVSSFSWPKFARAQEEFAKKHPEKCRADAIPTPAAKSSVASSTVEKPTQNATVSFAPTTTFGSATSKGPLFGTSPPRAPKPAAPPVWKCPSCSMEHPAQTSFCSVCKTRNTSYTRLTVLEPTATPTPTASTISKTVPDVVAEPPAVSAPSTVVAPITTSASPIITVTPTTTAPAVSLTFPITTPPTLAFPPLATTKETTSVSFAPPVAAMPSLLTTAPPSFFGTPTPLPTSTASSVSVPVTTKENPVINPPVAVTSAPMFGSFGVSTTTSTSNPFSLASSTTTGTANTFAGFGTLTSSSTSSASAPTTTTTTSTPATVLSFGATPAATTTAASTAPAFSFGSFNATPATTPSTSILAEKTPSFGFGTSASAPSLTSLASGALPTMATLATTTAAPASSTTTLAPNLFAFSAPSTSSTATSISNPPASTAGGFSFGTFPTSSSTSSAATNPAASAAPPLFGSSSGVGGFNFQPSAIPTTTMTSGSTSSGFGGLSAVRPFAPAVISSGSSGPTSSAPAFGSTAGFGAPSASASSFSAFSSTTSTPSFSFGSSTTSSTQGTAAGAPGSSTGGFAFGGPAASSTAGTTAAPPAIPTFGSTPPTSFNFGATSSLSFGSAAPTTGSTPFQFGGSAPSSNALYQFGSTPAPVPAPGTSLAPGGFGSSGENNPFNAGEENGGRRPMVKAKRRAKGN